MKTLKSSSTNKGSIVLAWSTLLLTGLAFNSGPAYAADKTTVAVDWSAEVSTSATAPSLLSIPYPNIRSGRPLHESAIFAIKSVNARYARYMPYCSHPQFAFPQLRAPTGDQTFWDFSLIDADLIAFLEATKGREPAINFSRIPHWMFKGGDSVTYPADPDKVDWLACANSSGIGYGHMELADPTGQQVADYMARIFSWYNQGGFTDELGKYHHSGHHYDLPWWGVFNEVDGENGLSPEQYTKVYDAVVAAIRKINPATKFIGMELANATPQFVEYFLDPRNHVPDTPIDMVSVHFVRTATLQPFSSRQYTDFEQLAGITDVMAYVDAIRKRLSPTTLLKVGELTMIDPEDWSGALNTFGMSNVKAVDTVNRIPKLHWNLAGAFYAAAFMGFEKTGVDIVAAAQLYGYGPEMLPSASLIDPRSGKPLPVIHVLRLLEEQLPASRTLVKTKVTHPAVLSTDVAAQAYRTTQGEKLLLVNKRAKPVKVVIEGDKRIANVETIDSAGVKKSALPQGEKNNEITLRPFAVSMIVFDPER